MNKIIKICKRHGELTIDQIFEDRSSNGLTFSLKCKLCRAEYYERNKDKLREKSREYERTRRVRPADYYEQVVKTKSREWRRKNKDLVNARNAEARKKDPERFREYDRKWRMENLDKSQLKNVVKNHNITYEKYLEMVEKQSGLCAMCGFAEKRKSRTAGNICRLAIDHNHKTGMIRELLCHGCNQVIGHAKESIEVLESAIAYLKKHKCS